VSLEPAELLPPEGWCLLLVRALVEDGTLTAERCQEVLRPLEQRIALDLGDAAAVSDARGVVGALVEALFDEALRGRFLRAAVVRGNAASAALVVVENLLAEGEVADTVVGNSLTRAVRQGTTSPTDGQALWSFVGRPDLGELLLQRVSDGEGEVS